MSSNGNNNPDRNGQGYWFPCKSLQMGVNRVQNGKKFSNQKKANQNKFKRLG